MTRNYDRSGWRTVAQLGFIFIVATLSTSADAMASETTKLQSTISKSTSLPLKVVSLTPGADFDEAKASAMFGGVDAVNVWYEIPAILTHWWGHISSESGDGKLARQELRGLSIVNRHAVSYHGFARLEDAKGHWWKWDSRGLWSKGEDGDVIRYTYGLEGKPTITSDTEFSASTQTREFVVDKSSNKIKEVSQEIRDIAYLVSDTIPKQMKTTVHVRAFDWHGDLTDDETWVSYDEDKGPSNPPTGGKFPDGTLVYDKWIEFLKANNLADRIPSQRPVDAPRTRRPPAG